MYEWAEQRVRLWSAEEEESFQGFMANEGDDAQFPDEMFDLDLQESRLERDDKDEITTKHYVDKSQRTGCVNPKCQAQFSLTNRPHHCRRCGEIYCANCLRYRRKLNKLAQPDTEGKGWKVCFSCFGQEVQTIGTTHSYTRAFTQLRAAGIQRKRSTIAEERMKDFRTSVIPAFWREQFKVNTLQECRRLLQGFQSAVDASETMKAYHEVKDMVKVPKWQKSIYWQLEKKQEYCRVCGGKLGVRRTLRNCKVCGLSLCKVCTHKDLLIYYDDDEKGDEPKSPRLAVIRIIGSPDVEPDVSLLVHVCKGCKDDIVLRQTVDPDWFIEGPDVPDVTEQLADIDAEVSHLRTRIQSQVSECQELLGQDGELAVQKSANILALVKAHLSKHSNVAAEQMREAHDGLESDFAKLEINFRKLKQLHARTMTSSQALLLKNYIKSKYDFYMENKGIIYRMSKKQKGAALSYHQTADSSVF